jgi:choline kinase
MLLHGRPLLEWQIMALRKEGIEEIAIVTGYKREQLDVYGLVEFHNKHWAETNMVSSLACADRWLQLESCIVSYSDLYYEHTAISSLINNRNSLAITYDPDWLTLWNQRFGDPLEDAEAFRLNSDHTLADIGHTPNFIEEVEGQYMGLLRFEPTGWNEVIRIRDQLSSIQRDQMDMTGMLQHVINAKRIPIKALPYYGQWMEVDSESDLSLGNTAPLQSHVMTDADSSS